LTSTKPKSGPAQLVAILTHEAVDAVLDVGANAGQYGLMLRREGFAGPILSFEPLPEPRAALHATAATDPAWQVAPAMALGDVAGEVVIERSAESDMSSVLPQAPLLQTLSPSSVVVERLRVPCARLDALGDLVDPAWRRIHLKIDVQGFEPHVLEGAQGLVPRLATIQLELSLRPVYSGEVDWRVMIERLEALGFRPALVLPGYFERKLARMLQLDMVFAREATGSS
jgi:FkbM family methyltransferase